jgi:Ni,Fe-hydrogenase III small subunit
MFVLLAKLQQLRATNRTNDSGSVRRGSLTIRHVDAGSCNGCEHELTAATNPFYDLQQYGLGIVASPRHADVLLVTGAVTTRMAAALRLAYEAMPEPRLVAALGDCALGCDLLGRDDDLAGPVDAMLPIDIRIPGCPPTPASIAQHLVAAIEAARRHSDQDRRE